MTASPEAHRVVVEQTASGFSAFSPDLPGVVTTGESEEEVRQRIAEAIELHLRGLEKARRAAR